MRVKSILVCAVAAGLATAVQAARFEAGKGVANDRATGAGPNDVTFVARGGENAYGYGVGRQYVTPLGLTILPWSIPNELSVVYGLRANFGFGRYERTYGIDAGAWSTSGDFGGVAANLVGNYVERNAAGVQVGVVNFVSGEMAGVQIGVVNSARCLRGLQVGLANFNESGIFFPIINFGF